MANTAHEIEPSSDIDAMIPEDIVTLTDPETDTRLFIAQENLNIIGCVFLDGRSDQIAEVNASPSG